MGFNNAIGWIEGWTKIHVIVSPTDKVSRGGLIVRKSTQKTWDLWSGKAESHLHLMRKKQTKNDYTIFFSMLVFLFCAVF